MQYCCMYLGVYADNIAHAAPTKQHFNSEMEVKPTQGESMDTGCRRGKKENRRNCEEISQRNCAYQYYRREVIGLDPVENFC